MAIARNDGGALGSSIGPRAIYTARGLSFAGLSNDINLGDLWDDFEREASASLLTGWFSSRAALGTADTQPVGAGGGIFQSITGVNAGGRDDWHALTGTIANVSTTRWYVAARFKVNTSPDAASTNGIGLYNRAFNKTIIAGVNGALDLAHFSVQYDGNIGAGSSLSLVTAPDTVFHIIELAGRADGKFYARLDGGAELSATMASAPADFMYPAMVNREGNANSQTRDTDWIMALYQRI